jgi:malonyl-CoA O-methyltransferase
MNKLMIKQINKQFSRYAFSYRNYNTVQRAVAAELVEWAKDGNLGMVLDVGCGDGEIFRQIEMAKKDFTLFSGMDLSDKMLELHPKTDKVKLVRADFNSDTFAEIFADSKVDTVFSSSALQWCRDPEKTFAGLSKLGKRAYFSFFTENTFKTLLSCAGIESPVCPSARMTEALTMFYQIRRIEHRDYSLKFDSVNDMFLYIKKSGVSGGRAVLGYREVKKLEREYPLDYLEFEVLLVDAVPRAKTATTDVSGNQTG